MKKKLRATKKPKVGLAKPKNLSRTAKKRARKTVRNPKAKRKPAKKKNPLVLGPQIELGLKTLIKEFGEMPRRVNRSRRPRIARKGKGGRARKNISAAEMSRAFHGRAPQEQNVIRETVVYEQDLAELGGLMEIRLLHSAAKKIEFDPEKTKLCANPSGRQLYIMGEGQEIPLKQFEADPSKEEIVIGTAKSVTYITDKQHLGKADKKRGPYIHELAEEGGERPILVYDRLNKRLRFVGGSYRIDRDMPGGFSAGIRD